MKLLLATLVMSVSFSAFAERVSISGRDLEFGRSVNIKQELRRSGYDADDYKLKSVSIVASGIGSVTLTMGGLQVDTKTFGPRGRNLEVIYVSPVFARQQNDRWELTTRRGGLNVRDVSVEIERERRGGGDRDDGRGGRGDGRGGHGGNDGRGGLTSDQQCYLDRYPDICQNSPKNYCKDPAAHYRDHGQREGRIWGCSSRRP